jgi:hypothetical protein
LLLKVVYLLENTEGVNHALIYTIFYSNFNTKTMNNFKKFYLDFMFIYGTISLFIALHIIWGKASYNEKDLLVALVISLTYAIIKLFWDNYNAERIESLENEIKQLKEEIAKKEMGNN